MELFHHSTFYHDYWKDYSETRIENGGKKKIQRTYIGDYYVFSRGPAEWRMHKFICVVLYIMQLICFFFGVLLDTPGNHSLLVVLPELCTALIQLILFLTCCLYILTPCKMTTYQYHTTTRRVLLLSRCCAVTEGLTIVMTLITCLTDSAKNNNTEQWVSLILLITSLFLAILLQNLEAGSAFSVIKRENVIPEGGNRIC